ncbi:CAAX amino terminal protease family protein, partial [gut metagenome]
MKTAIKLLLLYSVFQLLGGLTASPLTMLYVYLVNGSLDLVEVKRLQLAPAMLLGFIYTVCYLFTAGYLKGWKEWFISLSLPTMLWGFLGGVAVVTLSDMVVSQLTFLPDIMKDTFSSLQTNWLGVICLSVLGPILEELLFRGAITKVLLEKYQPTIAILFSGMLFGAFHINPVQVVSATLAGFFFAWLYYKTRNLLPCMLIHIFNNSLSVYLSNTYPEVETTVELIGTIWVMVLCTV